jgi:glycosyltransferase involved in cell wall biosynthesis
MHISVIIPTHNRAGLIGRALTSIFAQTFAPVEVIVVDDGSTDHTEALVRDRFPQVSYLRQPQQGVSRARNLGIQRAQGEWLSFLDSDDEWLPHKLALQRHALQHKSPCRLCHTDEIWIRRGKRVNPMKKHAKHGGAIFRHCLPRCVISPSSVMIHRTVFERVGHFDESLPVCEDYDLWLRICARYEVLYVPEKLLVKYGGHDDQLSAQYWGMDRFRIRALEKILECEKLSSPDREAVLRVLQEKIDIVLAGARKRNNLALMQEYAQKRRQYREPFSAWFVPFAFSAERPL